MRHNRVKLLVTCAFLCCLVVALSPGNAFAKSNVGPKAKGCIAGHQYVDVANWGTSLIDTSPKFGQYNPYSTSISKIWTASTTFSSTVSAGGSVGVDIDVIFGAVKTSVNSSISFTISGTYSDSITLIIPPHQTRYAQYGLFRQVADGDYQSITSSCQIIDLGYVESWSPWYVSWALS